MAEVTLRPADPEDVWQEDPGTWRGVERDGERTATVACPDCGRVASLSGHEILNDGRVEPSLVCPYDDCDWHEWVILAGWKPEPPTHTQEDDDG